MTKTTYIGPGNGVTGTTGYIFRATLNDSFPAKSFNVPENFNWSASLSAYSNITMVISYEHNLANGNIILPSGCTLQFNGGKLSNVGTLTGNGSRITNTLNYQCFDTTIIFAGTWINTVCTYEWFGAKSVPTRTSYTNECSAAINKANSSPFKIEPIPGFYYVANTIIYSKPKTIYFGPSPYEHQDDIGSAPDTLIPDHVRFITDQDIDVVDIRSSNVYLYGATIDVRGVGTYNNDAIKIKAQTAKIISGAIKMTVIGDYHLNSVSGASGKAFHFDMTDNTVYGFMANMDIDLVINFIPYGIYIDDPTTGHADTWMGVNTIRAFPDGCKQGFVVKGGFDNKYVGYTQTRDVLAYTEQDLYQAEFAGSDFIDIRTWDIWSRDYEETPGSGRYCPSRGGLLKSKGNILSDASLRVPWTKENQLYDQNAVFPVTHKSRVAIMHQKTNKSNFISEMNNILMGWDKKGTVTIKAHSGATIDFDSATPVIGSEAETANITIGNAHSLFLLRGYATSYVLNSSADLDKDFIEIALSGKTIRGINAFINVTGPKRIQIIGFKSVGNPDVYNCVPPSGLSGDNTFTFPLPYNVDYTSMAIRLIGAQAANSAIYINDIAVESQGALEGHNFVPATSAPKGVFHGFLTQSGTTDGTVITFLNSFYNSAYALFTPTLTRHGIGVYRFNMSDRFPAGKTMPADTLITSNPRGRVELTLNGTSRYDILTFNSAGAPADDILLNHPLVINTYW